MKESIDVLFELLQVSLGVRDELSRVPIPMEWNRIRDFAYRQGLVGFLQEGIGRLPNDQRPPQMLMLQWIGETLHGYEYRFDQYRKAIGEMAALYNAHGLKMMVLKGYACSLNWPRPNHRPCGDIDIWQFGRYREGDTLVAYKKGIEIDSSHHHHTVFYWGDFLVENHYDFVNVHAHRSSAEMEKVFKELGSETNIYELQNGEKSSKCRANKNNNHNHNSVGISIQSVEVCGEKVYLPSPNLHALFLIKHMVSHFAAAEINLRQVLDWAFFVEKHRNEVDWKWLDSMLERYSMKDFVNCINGICVEDLGFNADVFPEVKYASSLKDRILMDILMPKYTSAEPKGKLHRLIYKYKRWQANAWKQRLCYTESRWEYFCSGIWAKMLKPTNQ